MSETKISILTSVDMCIGCGVLQAPGFRGGTPIHDPQDTEHVQNKIEQLSEDDEINASPSDIPDHVTSNYLLMFSTIECPSCGNNFYHKTNMQTPESLQEINGDENLTPVSEL